MPVLRWVPLLLIVLAPLAASQSGPLKIEPTYPVVMSGDDPGTKDIHITYFPQNPEARIKDPQQLVLNVGINGRFWRDNKLSVPFVRNQNGAWEAVLSRKDSDFWLYLLFLVKDEKTAQVDDNGGHYWDLLFYLPSGNPHINAIEEQAQSYEGVDFENGIARKADYAKAVPILEKALAENLADSNRYSVLFLYWRYKVKAQGGDEQAWRRIAAEVDHFLSDHQFELSPLSSASGFIFNNQDHLPAALLAKDLELIDRLDPEQAKRIHSMALFALIRTEKNRRKRAEAYDAFIRKYPKDYDAAMAAAERFQILRDLGDVSGAESAFQQRVDANPEFADSYAAMAAVYIENKVKLDHAQQLLDKTQVLLKSGDQALHGAYIVALAPDSKLADSSLAYWQARLYLLRGKGELALPLALRVLESRKTADVQFVLAQAYEATGQKEKARDAYLEAVLTPSRNQREQMERLEKFWTAAGFGNSDQLLEKIESLQKERFKNAHYVPLLVDRPAPDFEVTALNGKKLRSSDLRDKTLVLNFWATWCMPCIPELPGFQQLQSKHPELVVAALAIQSDSESLGKLLRKMKLDALRIAPGDDLKENYVPAGVPITYLIDHGRIRVVHRGALSDVVAYVEADLAALKSPPSPAAR